MSVPAAGPFPPFYALRVSMDVHRAGNLLTVHNVQAVFGRPVFVWQQVGGREVTVIRAYVYSSHNALSHALSPPTAQTELQFTSPNSALYHRQIKCNPSGSSRTTSDVYILLQYTHVCVILSEVYGGLSLPPWLQTHFQARRCL